MTRTGKSSIFSGMVYCADCGSKMQYGSSNNRDFSQDFFDCSLHKKNGSRCKGHFIRVKVLEGRVLNHIQQVTDYILAMKTTSARSWRNSFGWKAAKS